MRSWASPQLPAWRSCCLHLAEETPQKWRGTGLQDKEVSDPSHGTSGVKPQKSDWGALGGSEGHRPSALRHPTYWYPEPAAWVWNTADTQCMTGDIQTAGTRL